MSKALRVVESKTTTGDVVPVEAKPAIAKYDAMRLAIKECHSIDVAKGMQSQAAALAVYHAQAKDVESENLMREIRVRAQRRAGEILIQMQENGERMGHGGPNSSKVSKGCSIPPSLSDLNIRNNEAKQWQDVARIPEEKFEQHLSDMRAVGEMPTVYKINAMERATKPRPIIEEAGPGETSAYVPPLPPRTLESDLLALRSSLRELALIETDAAILRAQIRDWELAGLRERLAKCMPLLIEVKKAMEK